MKFSPSIQYLRALAAMMVLVYHVALHLAWAQKPYYLKLSGGVDIFFVISGYVMWRVTAGRKGGSLKFIANRIRRIVPMYWILTTVMLVIMLIKPDSTLNSRFDLVHVLSSYAFIPSIHPVKGVFEPLLFPGWTLNYEMMFYVLFTLVLFGSMRWRLALIGAPILLLFALGYIPHPKTSVLEFYSSSLILEFAMGCALGAFACGPLIEKLPGWVGPSTIMLSGVLLLALSWAPILPRGISWGLPAAALVAGFVLLEAVKGMPRIPALIFLGDASYSIYLSHVIVLSAAYQAVRHFSEAHGLWGVIAAGAVLLVVTTASGLGVYWFIERRVIVSLGGMKPLGLGVK